MKNKKMYIAILISLFVVIVSGFFVYENSDAVRLRKQLEIGQKYLTELNYEEAVVVFNEAIEIEPLSVDAYLGLAEAYEGLGDMEAAIATLETGYEITGDERIKGYAEVLGINTVDSSTKLMSDTSTFFETQDLEQEDIYLIDLFEKGMTDNMPQSDELKFFGYDDITRMNMDTMKEIMVANGLKVHTTNEADGFWLFTAGWANVASYPLVSVLQYFDEDYVDYWSFRTMDYASDRKQIPVGIRNIYTYDTLSEVLEKLGFSNVEEIVNYVREIATWECDTREKLEEKIGTWQCSNENCKVMFNFSCSTINEDGMYIPGNFSLEIWNEQYMITFGFDDEELYEHLHMCTVYVGE